MLWRGIQRARGSRPHLGLLAREPARGQPRWFAHEAPKVNYYKSCENRFGDYISIASESQLKRNYEEIHTLTKRNKLNESIWLRGRVHNLRVKGNACFIILRAHNSTIQITYFKEKENPVESKKLIKFLETLTVESIVDVWGTLREANVLSCTQRDVEISLQKVFVVSRAPSILPFRIEDAARSNK